MQEGKETPSKSVQEGNEPLRKEDKGMDDALQGVEAQVPQSDVRDLYTDDDEAARWSSDEDERAVEAPCDDNLGELPILFSQPHNWGTLFWVGWIPAFGEVLQRGPHRRCCRRSWKLRVVRVLDLAGAR